MVSDKSKTPDLMVENFFPLMFVIGCFTLALGSTINASDFDDSFWVGYPEFKDCMTLTWVALGISGLLTLVLHTGSYKPNFVASGVALLGSAIFLVLVNDKLIWPGHFYLLMGICIPVTPYVLRKSLQRYANN